MIYDLGYDFLSGFFYILLSISSISSGEEEEGEKIKQGGWSGRR